MTGCPRLVSVSVSIRGQQTGLAGQTMKNAFVVLVMALCATTPRCATAEKFTTDKPTPLKLVKPVKDDVAIVRFAGLARLSGQFHAGWELVNQRPSHLRVTFLPDDKSKAILPHPAGSPAVQELLFSNREQAVSMLLPTETAQRLLARELLGAEGMASIVIDDYQSVIDCDHRWYLARLVSASRNKDVAEAYRDARGGC
jgi:hypothetical protein